MPFLCSRWRWDLPRCHLLWHVGLQNLALQAHLYVLFKLAMRRLKTKAAEQMEKKGRAEGQKTR